MSVGYRLCNQVLEGALSQLLKEEHPYRSFLKCVQVCSSVPRCTDALPSTILCDPVQEQLVKAIDSEASGVCLFASFQENEAEC